jgi:curved DNA-binding protein CbpA
MITNPYRVLGVPNNTPKEECKKAYRKLSRQYHPDNGGDITKFQEVSKAYEMIENGISIDFGNKRTGRLRHQTLFTFTQA